MVFSERGIGQGWGVPHHWGLELTLRGGCRPNQADITWLRFGALQEAFFTWVALSLRVLRSLN